MAARSTLVAVDTNVLLDLAVPKDRVHDAIDIFRRRAPGVEFVVSPTVIDELDYIRERGQQSSDRILASRALHALSKIWQFQPLDFASVGHGIVQVVAKKLRGPGLIPDAEVNDSYIVAEAAFLNCAILLTSDHHIRAVNPILLGNILKACDVSPVLARTPAEIVRQFG